MLSTIYQVYVLEITIFIIGILLLVKAMRILTDKNGNEIKNFRIAIALIFVGASLVTQFSHSVSFRYIASRLNPCFKNAIAYECLDQDLKLAIKMNKEHRSGAK